MTEPEKLATPVVEAAPVKESGTSTSGFTWLHAAGIALFVFVFFIYPVRSKSSDVNEVANLCQPSKSIDCRCVVEQAEQQLSVLYYVPLLRVVTKPSDAKGEALMMRIFKSCVR